MSQSTVFQFRINSTEIYVDDDEKGSILYFLIRLISLENKSA